MLSLALLATLVGFGLLVVAITISNLPFAIACVAVCVVGLILLVIDTLRANKRGHGGEDDEPLFTIRGRESASREAPLDDDEDEVRYAADHEDSAPASEPDVESTDSGRLAAYGDQTATTWSLADKPGGLGSLVSPASERDAEPEPETSAPETGSGGFAPLSGGFAAASPQEASGDVNDYLRATGSFPAQRPQAPESQPQAPVSQPQAPVSPPQAPVSPPQAPESRPQAPEPPRTQPAPYAQPQPQPSQPQSAEPRPGQQAPTPSGAESGQPSGAQPGEQPEPYVGRRRLAGDPTDDIIVRSANSDLPAMQFVWEDPDAPPKDDPSN